MARDSMDIFQERITMTGWKCTDYELKGVIFRVKPKKNLKRGCKKEINKEDAIYQSKWRNVIKIWNNVHKDCECITDFFWYWLTSAVRDKRPLNVLLHCCYMYWLLTIHLNQPMIADNAADKFLWPSVSETIAHKHTNFLWKTQELQWQQHKLRMLHHLHQI